MNTFETLLKKLKEKYQQNNDTSITINNKINDLIPSELEQNQFNDIIFFKDTGDIPLNIFVINSHPIAGTFIPTPISYFYFDNWTIPGIYLPFLDIETRWSKPAGNAFLTTAFPFISDSWMTGLIDVRGDGELIYKSNTQIFMSDDNNFFSTLDFTFNGIVTQSDIDSGKCLLSHCQAILSGPNAGKFQLYYDTTFLWPFSYNEHKTSGQTYPTVTLNGLPYAFTPDSSTPPTIGSGAGVITSPGTLPYNQITLKINPDPYPLTQNQYFNNPIEDYIRVNFSGDTTPSYLRLSKSTDTQEKWQVNFFYTGIEVGSADTIYHTHNYLNWNDTYDWGFVDLESGVAKWSYNIITQNHTLKIRNDYAPNNFDINTRIRVAIRNPFYWKQDQKFLTEIS